MPSLKTPSSLEVGPGRLSANVVSVSALTMPSSSDAISEASPPAVVSVFKSQTLTRQGPNTVVVVDGRPYIEAVAGANLVDGQTFTLDDRISQTVFEFNSTGGVSPGNIAVAFAPGDSAAEVAALMVAAIAGSGSGFSVGIQNGSILAVTNVDIHKAVLITDTVADGGFSTRSSNGEFEIVLPEDAQVGDTLTFIETTKSLGSITLAGYIAGNYLGAERLSGGFGSRTYVCAMAGSGWVASVDNPAIQAVHVTTALVRSGTRHVVLCDTSLSAVTVTLPGSCLVGDMVTVVLTGGVNDLTIDGSGADTIDTQLTSKIQGGSTVAFRTFLCVAAGLAWVTLEESQSVVEVTASFSVSRECRDLVVLVHTNDAGWKGGTRQVSTPSSPEPGDRFTVIDVDGGVGDGWNLRIQPPAGGVNGQSSSWDLYAPYSAITLRHVAGGVWVIESQSHHTQPCIQVSNTAVLERASGLFTVSVETSSVTWTDSDTITLPLNPSFGDVVFITDSEGAVSNESLTERKEINILPAGGATINGAARFRIGGGHGSAAFLYNTVDSWVTIAEGTPQNAVYNVFGASLTLPRVGANVLVRVSPGGGAWDSSDVITLPTDAVLGDRVTICQVSTGDGTDQIRVAAGAGNTINGYLTEYAVPLHVGTAPNAGISGVATFRKVAALVWLVESQFGPNEIISANNDLNLTRTSANMIVRVNTAAGTWDGTVDRITLPSTGAGHATPGDKVTIFDSDGQAAASTKTIVIDGGTINGASTFNINWAYGSATFILGPAGTWTSAGHGGSGRLLRRTIWRSAGAGSPLSGTHTLLSTTGSFRTYGMGPGGGGQGVLGNFSDPFVGKPGSSGALFDHRFTVVAGVPSVLYEVGAGGAGGVGDTVGTDGSGPTQVTYNGVTVGGGPGGRGLGIHLTSFPAARSNFNIVPTVIGTPDLGGPGRLGGLGFIFSSTSMVAGHGGPSFFGAVAFGSVGSGSGGGGADGVDGGGGAGALIGDLGTGSQTGGAGGAGILIVEEYS